ncbi:flavodoxin family protein [Thermodesulfobacteriota bacterium]
MMGSDRTLLIVFHSQTGNTKRLARAVETGARRVEDISVARMRASDASTDDLVQCRALVICSPEYFGYMAGAVKDFFDRTYEEARQHVTGKSYTVVICAGNDGSGALTSIERIVAGYNLRKVQEPIICQGQLTDSMIEQCSDLGHTLAAGMELGIY